MQKCADPDMSSFDNLFNVELLRDKWLTWEHAPGRGKLSGRGHLPGTLRSYLGSLCKFVQFLIREKNCSLVWEISILWDPNAQPYHQIPPKLKTIILHKASQTMSVSFSLRQAPR